MEVEKIYLPIREKFLLSYVHMRRRVRYRRIKRNSAIWNLLRERKLLESVYDEKDNPTGYIALSELGRNYIAYRADIRFQKATIPIAVSLLTNLAIHGIPMLLQLISSK